MEKDKEHKLSEVISIVSHQFKTPLSVIKGYLEVLIAEDLGELNSSQKEYLADAMQNTLRMIELVKDLLDVSRIEQGKLDFKIRPTNLEKITNEVIKEFSSFVRAKNCTIDFKALNKIPVIRVDPLKIEQVISNLISNAIKYNKRKGRVSIQLEKKGKNVIFRCKDDGIGISKADQKKVFDKFYRSEKAVMLATGGSGLGLFIAKAIIEKSKGEIWFESKEGQGSTFSFSLPIR
jgi:signal transduction histidine kinase